MYLTVSITNIPESYVQQNQLNRYALYYASESEWRDESLHSIDIFATRDFSVQPAARVSKTWILVCPNETPTDLTDLYEIEEHALMEAFQQVSADKPYVKTGPVIWHIKQDNSSPVSLHLPDRLAKNFKDLRSSPELSSPSHQQSAYLFHQKMESILETGCQTQTNQALILRGQDNQHKQQLCFHALDMLKPKQQKHQNNPNYENKTAEIQGSQATRETPDCVILLKHLFQLAYLFTGRHTNHTTSSNGLNGVSDIKGFEMTCHAHMAASLQLDSQGQVCRIEFQTWFYPHASFDYDVIHMVNAINENQTDPFDAVISDLFSFQPVWQAVKAFLNGFCCWRKLSKVGQTTKHNTSHTSQTDSPTVQLLKEQWASMWSVDMSPIAQICSLSESQQVHLQQIMYKKIFDWMIVQLTSLTGLSTNHSDHSDSPPLWTLMLVNNGAWEQPRGDLNDLAALSLNFGQEVIQRFFLRSLLWSELDNYQKNSIYVSNQLNVRVEDNHEVVQLIGGNANGILSIVDNLTLLSQDRLKSSWSESKSLADDICQQIGVHYNQTSRVEMESPNRIWVRHYPNVKLGYDPTHFCENNQWFGVDDRLWNHLEAAAGTWFWKQMVQWNASKTQTCHLMGRTVTQQWRKLISTLVNCSCTFVQCWDVTEIDQVAFNGSLDLVKLYKYGYPLQIKYKDFLTESVLATINDYYVCGLVPLETLKHEAYPYLRYISDATVQWLCGKHLKRQLGSTGYQLGYQCIFFQQSNEAIFRLMRSWFQDMDNLRDIEFISFVCKHITKQFWKRLRGAFHTLVCLKRVRQGLSRKYKFRSVVRQVLVYQASFGKLLKQIRARKRNNTWQRQQLKEAIQLLYSEQKQLTDQSQFLKQNQEKLKQEIGEHSNQRELLLNQLVEEHKTHEHQLLQDEYERHATAELELVQQLHQVQQEYNRSNGQLETTQKQHSEVLELLRLKEQEIKQHAVALQESNARYERLQQLFKHRQTEMESNQSLYHTHQQSYRQQLDQSSDLVILLQKQLQEKTMFISQLQKQIEQQALEHHHQMELLHEDYANKLTALKTKHADEQTQWKQQTKKYKKYLRHLTVHEKNDTSDTNQTKPSLVSLFQCPPT